MYYKQLTDKMKHKIDVLIELKYSMREIGKMMNISHSTVSRYKNKVYSKRVTNIRHKYYDFITYLEERYDRRNNSIEVCIQKFKRYYSDKPFVSPQQVYNWINKGLIDIDPQRMCYKRRKKKRSKGSMMDHMAHLVSYKTVLPISLRPQYLEKRDEIGHLEIDSIIGKRNEYASIISIVDRCSRQVHLIKAEYSNAHYINKLVYSYLEQNKVVVKSLTSDNGKEFEVLGICAKRLGVKLYKCDPYCSFQRGTNEHMNGIVRRYIPKGQSVRHYVQEYLDEIAYKINSMPRKMFGFKTPYEVHFQYIQSGAVEI